jgi:hypothetical protein
VRNLCGNREFGVYSRASFLIVETEGQPPVPEVPSA